jgi:ABC-type multidrug transport system fused ATPase/permease subunit
MLGAAKKLFEILETKSKIDIFDKSSDKKINKLNGNIQFEDVSFSYPQRLENRILNRFSLKIPAGKTVAFCGSR